MPSDRGEETGRPQDQGRRHRRKPPAELVVGDRRRRYVEAMRAELDATLEELAGTPSPAGLLPDAGKVRIRPTLGDRDRLVTLAAKIARELAEELDDAPPPDPAARARSSGPTRARRRLDFGGR
jgi:hypothetical protein